MTVTEKIIQHVKALPETVREEILDFVEYLESKTKKSKNETIDWSGFSLSQAMRGMESETALYSLSDTIEKLQ